MNVTAHRAPRVILRMAVALIAATALMTPASRASAFTFTPIDVPGAVETVARAISNDGDIVGHYKDANGQHHGFLLVNGVFTTIDFPSASQTRARGINKDDKIVGWYDDANGDSHGYVLDQSVFTSFDIPGAISTRGYTIKSSGKIIGRYVDVNRVAHGFILKGGNVVTIDVPGATDTGAQTHRHGRTLGNFIDANGHHGFLRDKQGNFTTIDFPSSTSTEVHLMNGKLLIVGSYKVGGPPPQGAAGAPNHGFTLHQPTNTFTTIDVPGATQTEIHGINNKGVMVGKYDDANGGVHGVLITP